MTLPVDRFSPIFLLLAPESVVVVKLGLVVVGIQNVNRQVGLAEVGHKVGIVESRQPSVGCDHGQVYLGRLFSVEGPIDVDHTVQRIDLDWVAFPTSVVRRQGEHNLRVEPEVGVGRQHFPDLGVGKRALSDPLIGKKGNQLMKETLQILVLTSNGCDENSKDVTDLNS